VAGETVAFLTELNQRIPELSARLTESHFHTTWAQVLYRFYLWKPVVPWSCARFVSGYQQGDPNQKELHAWAEVYLPGAGSPTNGIAVADRHVTFATSPRCSGFGIFHGGVCS